MNMQQKPLLRADQSTTEIEERIEQLKREQQFLAGGVPITPVGEVSSNMAILLWGEAGGGKTTLACTAPGNKLLVNFDPRGPSSVAYRSDVSVADYSGHGTKIVEEFKRSDPFGLSKVIDGYDT